MWIIKSRTFPTSSSLSTWNPTCLLNVRLFLFWFLPKVKQVIYQEGMHLMYWYVYDVAFISCPDKVYWAGFSSNCGSGTSFAANIILYFWQTFNTIYVYLWCNDLWFFLMIAAVEIMLYYACFNDACESSEKKNPRIFDDHPSGSETTPMNVEFLRIQVSYSIFSHHSEMHEWSDGACLFCQCTLSLEASVFFLYLSLLSRRTVNPRQTCAQSYGK